MRRPFKATDFDGQRWQKQLKIGVTIRLNNDAPLIIRSLQQQDIDNAFALEKACFKDFWPRAAFELEADDPKYRISLVGYLGQRLVSFALCIHVVDELHINNIAVDPGQRQQGIASSILWLLFEIGKYSDIRVSHLEVRRSNTAAIALYQKWGYEIVGIRKNYYEEGKEDALLMSRNHP